MREFLRQRERERERERERKGAAPPPPLLHLLHRPHMKI
jgi:hypothetical protein